MNNSISVKKMFHYVRKLRVTPRSIILFQDGVLSGEAFMELAQLLTKNGMKETVLVVVKDIHAVELLDEEEMNKVGWFRLPQFMKTLRAEQKPQEQSEIPKTDEQ